MSDTKDVNQAKKKSAFLDSGQLLHKNTDGPKPQTNQNKCMQNKCIYADYSGLIPPLLFRMEFYSNQKIVFRMRHIYDHFLFRLSCSSSSIRNRSVHVNAGWHPIVPLNPRQRRCMFTHCKITATGFHTKYFGKTHTRTYTLCTKLCRSKSVKPSDTHHEGEGTVCTTFCQQVEMGAVTQHL